MPLNLSPLPPLTIASLLGVTLAAHLPISSVPPNEWTLLNSSIDGRLFESRPIASPCYQSFNDNTTLSKRNDVCSDIRSNITNPFFISDAAGGYQNYNWGTCQTTGQGCPLAQSGASGQHGTCYQGSVAPKYVDVQTPEHVQTVLAFAQKHKIRIVVKNTGHDYIGRSSMPDSLQIWTHNMLLPLSVKKDFRPEGCSASSGDSITLGAGQQFSGLYSWAQQNNLHIVGGTGPTVGAAGGWIAGGGFGPLSPKLGLGVDNVQEMKVVLPNGTFVTANRCQNGDIFFALRGGGGGTFGVVTEMTTRVYPATKMEYASFRLGNGMNTEDARRLIDVLVDNGDRWATEGWGGYAVPSTSKHGQPFVILMRAGDNITHARESTQHLITYTQSLTNHTNATVDIGIANSVYEVYSKPDFRLLETVGGDGDLGTGGVAVVGRTVPRENFTPENRASLSQTLFDLMMSGEDDDVSHNFALFINIIAPSAYRVPAIDQPGNSGASAMHPNWRNAVWDVLHTRTWGQKNANTTTPQYVREKFLRTHEAIQPLVKLTPMGSGSATAPDLFETDPVGQIWGRQNYERLTEVKRRVDPESVLTCFGCIGFEEDEEAFSCVPRA